MEFKGIGEDAMKRLIAFVGALLLAAFAFAGDPVWLQFQPSSEYTISHSTIAVSSTTVTTIAGTGGGWRELYVGDPGASAVAYYTINGSSNDVTTVGSWIEAGKEKRIESAYPVYIQLESGAAADVFRLLSVTK